MERNPVFSQGTKRLLKNYIRHTDTHNRIQEENDMWKQYEKSKGEESRKYSSRHQNSYLEDKRDDMNDVRYKMNSCSAHMDDSREATSTYWMRQLEKTEAVDPERWGHSGFKELYPKDFDSDRSNQDSSSSSSLSSSTSEDERRKRKKRKKKKRHKKKVDCEWVEKSESVKSGSKNTDLNNRKTKKRTSEHFNDKSDKVASPKRVKKNKHSDRHKKKKKHKKHKD